MAPVKRELRLALAMRGGVSLAVWIGGAVQEIDRLRRGETGDVLVGLREAAGFDAVRVDVLSGASAGGLNGAILAAAMTNGRPVGPLRNVWLKAADLQNLLLPGGQDAHSVLDGDFFLDRLEQEFTGLTKGDTRSFVAKDVEVLLSVTSVVPYPVTAAVDRTVRDQRIDGQIRLRSRAAVDLGHIELGGVDEQTVSPAEYAKAARSTAGFPVAFAPVLVEPDELVGRVEFGAVRPDPLRLYDGGVVDNMPVGKALRAIDEAPADGPTSRYLLYLHPSPGTPDTKSASKWAATLALLRDRARPIDVLRSALKSLRTKSLAEDLAALEAHNREARLALQERETLLKGVGSAVSHAQVAAYDARRLVDLLRHPRRHLEHCVPPVELAPRITPETEPDHRHLEDELAALLAASGEHEGLLPQLSRQSTRPWSVPIRVTSLLIEWCRAIETSDPEAEVGEIKQALYDLRAYGFHRASELNRQTLDALADGPVTAEALLSARKDPLNATVKEVVKAWRSICDLAIQLRPHDTGQGDAGALTSALRARVPAEGATVDIVSPELDALDLLLLPQHRHAPTGSLEAVAYRTIAGTANTPASDTYSWPGDPDDRPAVTSLFRSLRAAPVDPSSGATATGEGLVDPGSKLAGNQLHNFAAFLSEDWRANDWMWGQADAACSLVDLLLEAGVEHGTVTAERIRELCVAPEGLNPEVAALARQPWLDADGELDAGRLAAVRHELTTPASDRRLTKGLLVWRRHLEVFQAELLRPERCANPTGSEPKDTLAATAAAWDRAPRRLSASWGKRRLSALGNRASFVAQKAFFNDVGLGLRSAGVLLGLVLSPAVALFLGRRRTLFASLLFIGGVLTPRTAHHLGGRLLVAVIAIVTLVVGLLVTRRPREALSQDRVGEDPDEKPLRWYEWWALLSIAAATATVAGTVLINKSWFDEVRAEGDWYPVVVAGVTAVATLLTWLWARWYWCVIVVVVSTGLATGWAWVGANAGTVADWCGGGVINAFGSFWFALIAITAFTTFLGYTVDVASHPRRPVPDDPGDC